MRGEFSETRLIAQQAGSKSSHGTQASWVLFCRTRCDGMQENIKAA